MKKTISVALFICSLQAIAGGPAWLVSIGKVSEENGKTIIELNNKDEITNPFQACNPLVIVASYEGEPWYSFTTTWSKHVTKELHDKAIGHLY